MLKSRLKEKYKKEIMPLLKDEFEIKNTMSLPRVEKIVINMGVGEMIKNKELGANIAKDLALISGQAPSLRRAKVSIAAFGLRRGMPVGFSVTLRGVRMYDFLDKLISLVLPRLRDFRGVKTNSFDKSGNYTLGFSEHTVFPEIDASKAAQPRGFEVVIVINSGNIEKSKRLLELLGMPFTKDDLAQGKPIKGKEKSSG
ncbi:50S ribosomal protein L5 [Candidatus Woesebacteria bacterium RIFOXYA1_FULL_40_18]|uniref:Large ribosomal subunit protein uL5 n=5 Tax=Candidatus Woeseibacteriota TaxID=1752722 RepID=A0A0G0SFC4_9BACT|nr:MAG: 50S ribosomal protein L5 [Candidatus Woesebacteria bacterium GW2011_GWB1_40_101]KKR63588.1 MAG: 50S ribosomal protein L5 [Candidatus Woesebacteria bacterium GW2011_GWA1_40_45]OGM76466.1 MAG: 50S ribosomal protein L5 [Candidatus Woesebacteria bacterium RIFOXYA1_FULL_40_18]OGM81641.1 MAG: 50S ribosomal protein L5 [Candidatus Woesebacteria bacterium RIFOXYB1_FULL_40_26]OGM87847.1 MAG: 50S ribosomal protein L5 [Candidatus Woesebacteria bacterium RIFOXYD1_FULL_40_21]